PKGRLLPHASRREIPKSRSSPAEHTSGCEERMRSTRVVPVLGIPNTKMGSDEGWQALPDKLWLALSIAANSASSCLMEYLMDSRAAILPRVSCSNAVA